MNIKQAAVLLEQEGIRVEATGQSIHVIPAAQDENIYKLEKRDEQWVYLFVQYERNSEGREMIVNTFRDETEAANYFFLVTLQSCYFQKYIFPFKEKNTSLKIGTPSFTMNALQKALSSLQVVHTSFSFFDEEVVPHSIHLKRVSPTECKVQYIGNNKQEVFETIELEDWDAYSAMFDYVYLLALLDQKCKDLAETHKIEEALSDEDYAIFLTA